RRGHPVGHRALAGSSALIRRATKGVRAASKRHDLPPRAATALPPAVRRRVRRGRPGRLREPAVRPAARRRAYQHARPPGYRAGQPRQRAVADAARIMASFPRPPGALRTGLIASLTEPGEWPGGSDLARVTRRWRVPGRSQAV